MHQINHKHNPTRAHLGHLAPGAPAIGPERTMTDP